MPTIETMSCTTILVGKKASYDGSTIIARDDDSGSGRYDPKKFVVVAPQEQPRHYRSVLSHVEIDLPDNPCRYSIVPNVLPNRGILAEAGVNERNVAMSATETIAVNERVLAAEIIREKLLNLLDDEVPHGVAVCIERMHEREDSNITDIDATIYCERESHKGIIIGKKGEMLKKVSTKAREDMERFFMCKINLHCWVKVKEGWRNREGLIHNFGLDNE